MGFIFSGTPCSVYGFISDVFGTENLLSENASMYDCFEQNNVPFERKSADVSINQYGYSLIDLCMSNNLLMWQRLYIAKTYMQRQKYNRLFLPSPFVFNCLHDVCVCVFSSLFSDAHSSVSLTLKMFLSMCQLLI